MQVTDLSSCFENLHLAKLTLHPFNHYCLDQIRKMKNLEYLDLSDNDLSVDDRALAVIGGNCHHLIHVAIRGESNQNLCT